MKVKFCVPMEGIWALCHRPARSVSLWLPCTYHEKAQVSVPHNLTEHELFEAKIFHAG